MVDLSSLWNTLGCLSSCHSWDVSDGCVTSCQRHFTQYSYQKGFGVFYVFFICPAAECGGRFKGESSGRILSPGYPFPYDNNLRCTWTIEVDSGNIVSLQFLAFDTEASHDMLKVWDGPPENEMSLAELSGSLLPEGIHSTLNTVTVQFETDFYISKSGFAIEFSSK
ncbi:CUB and sushi domain-containing protein 3-like [Nothobranchius furzeri]|uniref:CUB and sushi domain-containing protein 3-like n=1 Tax=Nothobranchius furzeri TaxID=105023 RepID=A0A9D3B901_NOTFU|nr:CUB and sushi domain-containing protein 3-like [Nothobranchius furzeri]